MEVIRARYLGFCSGVKLALDIAAKAIEESRNLGVPCYIYGDIVHNAHVMDRLRKAGVVPIDSPDGYTPGIIIIRTHGITDNLRNEFILKGFTIKDATCPVVLKNQERIRDSKYPILIIGISGHSELVTLEGSSNKSTTIIEKKEDLDSLNPSLRYNAIVQTTFSSSALGEIKARIEELGLDIVFLNDICASSQLRREAIKELCGKVDAAVIVGDKKSANTCELFKISKEMGLDSFLADSVDSISPEIKKYATIGISAGASTPDCIYNEVEAYLRSLDNGR